MSQAHVILLFNFKYIKMLKILLFLTAGAATLIIGFLLFCTICMFDFRVEYNDFANRKQLLAFSKEELQKSEDEEYQEIVARDSISTDSADNQRLERVMNRLLESNFKTRPSLKFCILKDTVDPNACAGSKYVYVNKKLLDFSENDDDMLAFVLSHELSHMMCQHYSERMAKHLLKNATLILKPKMKIINLIALSYTRTQEAEADKFAVRLTHNAGYNPAAGAAFFRRLSEESNLEIPAFLSTHPSHKYRVEKIEQAIKDLNN